MVKQVPVGGKDQLEFVDNKMSSLDAIRLWVPFLYNHAPWWLWDAILGEKGETVSALREEMDQYDDLQG